MDERMLPSHDPLPPFVTTPCRDMGLDELARLVNQIATQVQNLISAPPPPETNKYTDGLYSLRAAFEQGLAIIGGLFNAVTPIHRLPPYLLTQIFALSPRAVTHGYGQHQLAYWPFKAEADVAELHKLTKVCRYWRDLATATPTLWTTVGSLRSSHNGSSDPSFHYSKYLPENSSCNITVHFNPGFGGRAEAMVDFMLSKAPSIRDLHLWDMASIPDVPSFLLSFDASLLEHCTLWRPYTYWGSDIAPIREEPLPDTTFLPFFSNGGPRLRSLYLTDFDGLPTNEFPALALLVVASIEFESHITMDALLKFLAGCPRLEEVYIHNIQRCSRHATPPPSPPIFLPRLRYLFYTYGRRQRLEWEHEESTNPIEYLLSYTSIPSTCHMYFTVYDEDPEHRAQTTNHGILDSVCRHVPGKDAVSHLFLWLLPEEESDDGPSHGRSSMQLMFSQGSLRLEFKSQFDCVNLLDSYSHLFSTTEDLRIRCDCTLGRYTDLERALATSLPANFPELKVLSLIPEDYMWMDPNLRPVHSYLAEPLLLGQPEPASGRSSPDPEYWDEDDASISVPHPGLDTLWIFVQSAEAIAPLKGTISGRRGLGSPIRCIIVHHCFAADSTALARLQALDAMVEELILTDADSGASVNGTNLREVDWMVGLPDKFSLPAAIRRDWPTGWYRAHLDGQDS
ncbi:hypothetical protein GSI_07751 [Ganoderma sinense ZZ0214-1]|uniref:Uncharacterized protein n=1 Tax=Ganoderma sinense ZZ0214-1 TaxID=1077348 RepID=A0A2G8S8P8_9APHY|nr:hypothetical protein GSI_07684 [Ganoderma sinense ZZ0214-1]PIL30173.1 hypothetical protein GSI_07751 [Ganoderma sinense ZZ0214-1]